MDKALEFYNHAIDIYLKNFNNDNILFGLIHLSIRSVHDLWSLFTEVIEYFTIMLEVYRKFNENDQHLGVAIVLNLVSVKLLIHKV